jgi:hypothetical protein
MSRPTTARPRPTSAARTVARQVAQRAPGSRRIRVDAGGKLPRRGHAGVLPVQRPRRRSRSADLSRLSGTERVPRIRAATSHRARRVGRRVRARTTPHPASATSRRRGSELKSRCGRPLRTPDSPDSRRETREIADARLGCGHFGCDVQLPDDACAVRETGGARKELVDARRGGCRRRASTAPTAALRPLHLRLLQPSRPHVDKSD